MANSEKRIQPVWKANVKRGLMAILWVYLIWLGVRLICGFILFVIIFSHNSGANDAGQIDARATSLAFMQHYGWLVFIGSFGLAVFGVVKGILPGTKREAKVQPVAKTSSAVVWPPPPSPPEA